jgi:uncharacterized protein (DUF983 family)
MTKGTKLYTIFFMKCPRCHEGPLWKRSILSGAGDLVMKGDYSMYDNCPTCGQKYILETGFYWGAMYIAYALSSFVLLFVGLMANFYYRLPWKQTGVLMAITSIVGFLYNARLSRSIWLSFFVKYDPNVKKMKNEKW